MRASACIAAALIALLPLASAQTPAGPTYTPIAHSALVAVEGAVTAQTLLLRVRRTQDQQPLPGAALSLTIDGRSVPAAERSDGTWAAALPELPAAAAGQIEIVVAHDGVREVLEGSIPRAGASSAPAETQARDKGAGFFGTLMHKQASWWILNILIVLIGVIAVSRRMS